MEGTQVARCKRSCVLRLGWIVASLAAVDEKNGSVCQSAIGVRYIVWQADR